MCVGIKQMIVRNSNVDNTRKTVEEIMIDKNRIDERLEFYDHMVSGKRGGFTMAVPVENIAVLEVIRNILNRELYRLGRVTNEYGIK